MLIRLAALLVLITSQSFAQSATQHVALGDRAYSALNANVALAHFEAAAKADSLSYAALWKSSRSLMDIAATEPKQQMRDSLYAAAEKYARRAISVAPNDAEGHFSLARALGKTALAQSPKGRTKYAKAIRQEALRCLEIDPKHAGCLHVMGMWNAEVRRLSGFVRKMAETFLGGKIFATATWAQAIDYMERAVALEPNRIAHRIDLAEVYRDAGFKDKARTEFEAVLRLPVSASPDASYKSQAREALRKL